MLTLTVSQLNEYIKSLVDSVPNLSDICIKGEISNFTNHYKSGHFYFTLKDKDSLLKAVMFRTYAEYVHFIPQNGMKVTARGRLSVYVRDGAYQLYCEELIPDGVGDLYLAYEQLKGKLEAEGLFDEDAKKPLPAFPKKIGIVTSPTGAAIADMLNILSRRFPIAGIELYPALVQGDGAPKQLIDGLSYFDGHCDVIIIGRGGGSIEDLWAFNDEQLARRVYSCTTPVISAVGHETDFTICDFVADMRAPTPSAAAELSVPDKEELRGILKRYGERLGGCFEAYLGISRERLSAYGSKKCFLSPFLYTDEKRMTLDSVTENITKSFDRRLAVLESELTVKTERFAHMGELLIPTKRHELSAFAGKLSALNPLAVLSRGYAAVFSEDGKVISSVNDVKHGDTVTMKIADGRIEAKAEKVTKENAKQTEDIYGN